MSEKLAIPVFIIAGGLAYLANEFHMLFLIPFAFGIFGMFALILGMEAFILGRIRLLDRLYSRREQFSGLPAKLLGVAIFLFGIGIVAYTAWDWLQPGKAGEFLAGLVETNQGRGILAITFGFFVLLFGLVRLIAGSAHPKEKRSALVDLGFRLRGFFGILIGIALLTARYWLILE